MRNIEEVEMYKNVSGIYYILEDISKRIYIGSSVNIRGRVRQHYTDLSSGIHRNKYLQRTWDKKTSENFTVGVIEFVKDKEDLLDREQFWMNFFQVVDRNKGFNLSPTAGSNLGFKKTKEQIENNIKALQGKRYTILSQEEVSEVKKMINNGSSLGEIARAMDVEYETIRSIKRGNSFKYVDPQIDYNKNLKAKLVTEDVIEIKKMLNKGMKVKEISEMFDVSYRTISAIKNEVNWKNVGDKITIPIRKSRKKG